MVSQDNHKTHQILVVDDEPNLLALYQIELEQEGYQVITATNGEDAINLTKKASPEIVVLDIKINKVFGLEVLKEIKKFDKNILVILNSAYTTFKSDFSCWMADAYIVKSSDLSELKGRIKELLQLE